MAAELNQSPADLYEKYRAANNVGISYTGLVYNLDVGYGVSTIYNSDKNRFIELSPNFNNKVFTLSTPGDDLVKFKTNPSGIGTESLYFIEEPTSYVNATIPGIGTDSPSKLTVEMWIRTENFTQSSMFFSFGVYDVWLGRDGFLGSIGYNAFDAINVGITKTKVQDLLLEGTWNHYVFVMTPVVSNTDIVVENKIYINSYDQGSLINNAGSGGSQNNRTFSNGNFRINGVNFLGHYKLNMTVGLARVYNRELTSEEVTQNYNATKARYFPEEIVSDGLVVNLDATNASSVGVGTTWFDLSGNGNNGTLVNGPYHSDGPFLDAGFVSFDGTDDYISIGSTTDFAFGTGDFTVEAWVRRNGDQVGNATIACVPQSAADTNWQFNLNASNKVVYKIGGGGGDVISSSTVPDKTWTHVSVTRSGTTLRLFIDGVEEDSATSSEDLSDDDGIRIGRNRADNAPVYFKGEISNLRLIKGTALYTSNFTPPTRLLTAVDNTVLLTCQKETIRDGSIDIHTVTANNGAAANLGFPSSSYEFDGSDDYASLTSSISVTDFTYETWVYHTPSNNASDYGYFFSGQSKGLAISEGGTDGGLSPGDLYYYNGSVVSLGCSIHPNRWEHVVAVCDGTSDEIEIYVNAGIASTTSVSNIQTSITELSRWSGGSNYLNGKVSGVRVYNDKLTSAEVLQNYNATKRNYPKPPLVDGSVLYLDSGNSSSYPGSGTTWFDISGNGNNGTLINGPTYSASDGGIIVFDGTDDRLEILHSDSFIFTNEITLSAWFNFSVLPTTELPLIRKNDVFQLGLFDADTIRCLIRTEGTSGWTGANDQDYTFSTNTWYNMTMTYDGSNMKIYVNATLEKTATVTGNIENNSNIVQAGYLDGSFGVDTLDGSLSILNIYNYALTSSEVTSNFDAVKSRFGY